MTMFSPENRTKTMHHRRLYAMYELFYTLADFTAAISFLVGSILFFDEALETVAIWFFVVGSFFFLVKPSLRVIRELHYLALGDFKSLADRAEA